jgi:hypothetical protein
MLPSGSRSFGTASIHLPSGTVLRNTLLDVSHARPQSRRSSSTSQPAAASAPAACFSAVAALPAGD